MGNLFKGCIGSSEIPFGEKNISQAIESGNAQLSMLAGAADRNFC